MVVESRDPRSYLGYPYYTVPYCPFTGESSLCFTFHSTAPAVQYSTLQYLLPAYEHGTDTAPSYNILGNTRFRSDDYTYVITCKKLEKLPSRKSSKIRFSTALKVHIYQQFVYNNISMKQPRIHSNS